MCGIAGLVGRLDGETRTAVARMNAALSHRGPDAEGIWESPVDAEGFGVALAHRRLAILDLSPAGVQPMRDPQTGSVIVFNGEIYNFEELRAQLVAAGERFDSSGDTAVMLRSLGLQGPKAISRLRGMFAFAFWNRTSRELLLARDPLGIKPLYVARNPDPNGSWRVIFASEVRAILSSGLLGTARLNTAAIRTVLWNGFTVAPDTAVAGVSSLMPGEYLVLDSRGQEVIRDVHWNAAGKSRAVTDEQALERALQDSVRLHLSSDVPLGVFLSGGVDSSAIANLAQRSSSQPVHTFTLAFEEGDISEGEYAREIAKAIGTHHTEVLLTEQYFVQHLGAAIDSLDQPSFDGLNSFFMSRAVRDAGFKVALVGSGGDELFGGYTSFRDIPALLKLDARTSLLPRSLKKSFAHLYATVKQPRTSGFKAQTRWAKLPAMVEHGNDTLALYQLAYALFLPETQAELINANAGGDTSRLYGLPRAMYDRLREDMRNRTPLSALSLLEQRLFLGERLLRDTDAVSMAASIEIRLPLVDQVLFETVDALKDDVRYGPIRTKALLRRIGLKGLDPRLFDRPKSGFELPYDRWLRSTLGRSIDDVLRDRTAVANAGLNPQTVERLWTAFSEGAPGLYWTRIWAIYSLVHWANRHNVVC